MKRIILLKILPGTVALLLLIKFISPIFVEPWIRNKILATLNDEKRDYIVEIDKVRILMTASGIELEGITIYTKRKQKSSPDLNGTIASIKFKGIKLRKILFKKEIDINSIIISNGSIKGRIPFSKEEIPPIISTLNMRINSIFFNKTYLQIENTLNAQSFLVKEGDLKVYDLNIEKRDTISLYLAKQFDFEAKEFFSVSADSMYSYTATGIVNSTTSKTLKANSFSIQPNYTDYDFTARYQFQTDRIEAVFSNIVIKGFNFVDYIMSGRLISSWIKIGKTDIKVFRDKRKEFRHANKPAFQDIIYNYPVAIQIDSIGLINGNITYTEHAEEANEPGSISFNEINAGIYNISNDTVYKTESAFLELKGNALLMGKGRMDIFLKAKLFDSHNTFSLNGTISGMEASALNPMLEKSAFIYVTSGKIEAINFSFSANDTKAAGYLTMLYNGLDLAVKNKKTDDTTAFKERFISYFVNRKVMDSNPLPGEDVRVGLIDYERDPERFLFNYCTKSILTGIRTSIQKSQKK